MDSVAITDHGVMYGVIEFYKACLAADIKPIIGVEMYVAKRSYKDKEGKLDSEPYHLTVLAKNYQGYLNLMKLTSIAHLDGFYYRPRVDKELLKEYHEGLIALSGCPGGEFVKSLKDDSNENAKKVAQDYLEIFGEGNYYLELQNHHWAEHAKNAPDQQIKQDLERMGQLQDLTFASVKEISAKLGIPIVATKDFHYVDREDADAQDAVLCVQTGSLVSETKRLRMIDTPEFYVKTPDEMAADFLDYPEALENTQKIADMINVEIELTKAIFPVFKTPKDEPAMEYLRELTYQKAPGKVEMTEEVIKRLDYELDIIDYKKLAGYFLVVSDFIAWSHTQGIITNTRGSAAGSLVLYCLGVTNLNPLDYLLPFERFLTKDRPYMPDIDADLADDRRDEVIHYLMDKYGKDKVAHIVTFGTMMGRAAIRDIGRVLGVSYGEVDRIAKLVPPPKQGFHITLATHIKDMPELNEIYKSNPQYKKLLDLAIKVEGTVRHASVHAAGILITPEDITNYTPIQKEADGDKIVSQYDMYSVVDEYNGLGLVKMDLLGIRNLSILGRAVEYVKNNQGIEVNLEKIPIDDKKTYELLSRGETMGVFQLEGSGMTKYLVDLKPTNIFNIQAMVALYRPGPISVIPEYIARKHDPKKIRYFDPRMKDYTEQSLGLLVYQDDVLLTATNIAGYTWTQADKFRKAMGKKKPEEMAKEKDHFVLGCVENGMKQEKAEELFKLFEPFAAYGFNKAHAASYAIIAYQTAYMKANYPVEFMAAVMTAEYGDSEKIARAMNECKKMGIVVLPPNVNFSKVGFTIEGKSLRFGLSAIKNVGISAIESIILARNNGEFKSLGDLVSRVDNRLVNKKTLESLIKAGALDNFGNRASQLLILNQVLEESHKSSKNKHSGMVSLFGDDDEVHTINIKLPDVEEMPLDQLLIFEKDLLGFYLHEPLFLKKLKLLGNFVDVRVSDLTDEHVGKKLTLGGVIVNSKKVITKKNASEMAFVSISDGIGQVEMVVFPKTYLDCKNYLNKDEVISVVGRIDKREDELSVIVDSVQVFDPDTADRVEKTIEIRVPRGTDVTLLQKVNKTLRQFPGDQKVALLLPNGGGKEKRMVLPFFINPDASLEIAIKSLLGDGVFKRTS